MNGFPIPKSGDINKISNSLNLQKAAGIARVTQSF